MDLIAYIDGGARGNPGPAAIGVVVCDGGSRILYEAAERIGHATNNEAEYRALIHLLEACAREPVLLKSGAKTLHVRSDSQLLVMQVTGKWKIREPRLRALHNEVQKVKTRVPFALRIRAIPREKNKAADKLVNAALDSLS